VIRRKRKGFLEERKYFLAYNFKTAFFPKISLFYCTASVIVSFSTTDEKIYFST